MSKSVKQIVVAIGALALLFGIYSAASGSNFSEYFSGIFLGIVLIGAAFFYKDPTTPEDLNTRMDETGESKK